MTISEVATSVGLSQDTLRFYEKEKLVGPIAKTTGGIRNYSEDDLKRIKFIKCMRSAELPIDVLREYIELYDKGDSTKNKRKELLIKQKEIMKEKLDNMQKAYELLSYKIDYFYSGREKEYYEKIKDKDDII